MKKAIFVLPLFILTACSHSYYVVRHAEKASASGSMAANDPPLTEKGTRRAIALKDSLIGKGIHYIFSTNTIRTKTTAGPLAESIAKPIATYKPIPDSSFLAQLKALKKNTLIVGHSNTIDDVINGLCGTKKLPADLADSEYDNLYIIKYSGKKFKSFVQKKYGEPGH
ncbi:MAG: histidine phosphatase family protein [Gemmatimonadaceae bacterium]|nr:histidine phosphatase family protein [Chitinophagaceae bacterium]